jgi:hypothetical protein
VIVGRSFGGLFGPVHGDGILRGHAIRAGRGDGYLDREESMTAREDVLARLDQAALGLRAHAVKELWLFGSAAREEMRSDSDIDILVDFSAPVTLFDFARLRRHLAALLGRPVDLVTRDALKPSFRDQILREAVRAA